MYSLKLWLKQLIYRPGKIKLELKHIHNMHANFNYNVVLCANDCVSIINGCMGVIS